MATRIQRSALLVSASAPRRPALGTDRGQDARGQVGDRRARASAGAGGAAPRRRGRSARQSVQPARWAYTVASSQPGSSPSRRAEIAWRICIQVIRGSRPPGSGGSPSIVGRSGRADAAVPRRSRRRSHRAPPRRPRQPGRRLAPGRATWSGATTPTTSPRTRSSGRGGRCPRSGAIPAPAPGSSRSPGAPAPTRCAATSVAVASPTGWRAAAAAEPRRRDRPGRRARGRGVGRRPPRRPARRLRAHPGRRVLLRGGGGGVRRADRHHPLARRPRPRAAASRRCAASETG